MREGEFTVPAYVITGTDNEASLGFVEERLGLDAHEVWLLARAHNHLTQSLKYKERTIIIKYPGESRLAQAVRLFGALRRFEGGLCFWRSDRNFLVNFGGLGLVLFVAGWRGKVVYEGNICDIRSCLNLERQAFQVRLQLIELVVVIMAGLLTGGRVVCQYLRRSRNYLRLWLQMAFTSVSIDRVSSFCANCAARYFYYEQRVYSSNRIQSYWACSNLCLWAAWSLLFSLFYYPLILANRLLKTNTGAKKVLFASHESKLNGAPRSLLIILENLDKTGFEPFLLSATEGLLTRQARAFRVPVIVLPVSQLLTQSPGKHVAMHFVRFLISLPYLLALLATLRIQITHTNVLVMPDLAFAAKLLSIPHLWHFREAIGDNLWAKVQIWALNRLSDRILCNSDYSRRLLNSRGIFWPKIVTVRNVIDATEVNAKNSTVKARTSMGVGADEILIGCVGQITPVKGQETFVRAAVEVAREFNHVKFAIVGTTENQSFVGLLTRIISEANLSHRIKFCGFRTDIADVMGALDIHVTPSQWDEPFGRVALESMAAGAVSVVSKIGGLPEIVLDEVTGIHVLPGSVNDLVSALTRLIVDADLRRRLREAGVRRAQEHFSVSRHLDDLENIYRYPLPTATPVTQSRLWAIVSEWLPGRMRSHPKLLVYYPVLIIGIGLCWLLTIPLFVLSLPFAIGIGWLNRRNMAVPRVGVLAYQTVRNAATRFRITKPFERLAAESVDVRIYYPSSAKLGDKVYVSLFYGHLPYVKDFYYYIVVFVNRLLAVLKCYSHHCVVLQYELFYEGPMWLELLVAHTHPRVIYDYDDSLYVFPRYAKYLPKLLKAVDQVVVGNNYIAEYSRKYNSRVSIIPTCPDHEAFAQRKGRFTASERNLIRIGWIGNPANLVYLKMVSQVFRRLSNEYPVFFIIICAGPYDPAALGLENLPIRRLEWSLDREAVDISSFDIGIMPVSKDVVGEGKCGFKALQYMAAGIPCVASPVGINVDIIQHGTSGYLAYTEDEWYRFLKVLVESSELRQLMGERGRQYTLKNYSLEISAARWSEIIRSIVVHEGYVQGDLCQSNISKPIARDDL